MKNSKLLIIIIVKVEIFIKHYCTQCLFTQWDLMPN